MSGSSRRRSRGTRHPSPGTPPPNAVDETFAAQISEQMLNLEGLVERKQWDIAEPICSELLEYLPRNHWINARMSEIVTTAHGEQAALGFAQAALDTGFCCASCSQQIADVLYTCGDYVRATAASAVALILGGRVPRLNTEAIRTEAVQFLVTYIEGGRENATIDGAQMDGLYALALARVGDLQRSYAELKRLDPDALSLTNYDTEVQAGLLEYRLGLFDLSERRLSRRSEQDKPAQALAYLALVHGLATWSAAVRTAERAVEKVDDTRDAVAARSVLTICHALNDDADAAKKALEPFSGEPALTNLMALARLLIAIPMAATVDATFYALRLASWDESGDVGLPCAQEALQRLIQVLEIRPRSLTAAQALLKVEPLILSG